MDTTQFELVSTIVVAVQLKKEREEAEANEKKMAEAAAPKVPRKHEEEKIKVYKTTGVGRYINPSAK